MNFQTARLAAKVAAVNRANKHAKELYAAFSVAAAPFVGQKIFKADGEMTAKFKAALPKFPFFFYQYRSEYSLLFIAKESEGIQGQSSCIYAEASSYIGSIDKGVLTKLHDAPNLRTNFTVEEISKLREDAREAEKVAEDVKRKVPNEFGMFDR